MDDRTYEPPERLTLGSDARRMTIRFSALTYSGATDLCIGYQLVGFAKAKAYTVGSWLEVWMENYAKIKLRPSTYKTSQGFLKNHIKPQIGSIPLADLTSLDLQRFYQHLLDGGRVDRIEAKKKPKGLAPKDCPQYPPDDRLGVQPRHAAHRAAHNKGAILYRRE